MKRAEVNSRRPRIGIRRRSLVTLISLLSILGVTSSIIGVGKAEAANYAAPWVNSCGMPTNSAMAPGSPNGKVQVRVWSRPGNYKTVILLDGMRANYFQSGWQAETNVARLADRGVNVVMPIGGPASFYTNWDAPSNFNGQQNRYMWECVITQKIPPMLRGMGLHGKYAIMGISSGGNAALSIAARHPALFDRAGSLSGYNWLTAPGMRTALRLAMLDVQPAPWNIDSMWGPPWSPRWANNDPFMLINRMGHLKHVFIGSGNGLFGHHNHPGNFLDDLTKGSTLELLAFTQAKAFEAAGFVQGLPMMTYYANGTHAWGYWQDMVWNAHSRGFFR